MSVPILPPTESHRAGISLVAALEARVEAATAEVKRVGRWEEAMLLFGIACGMEAAYEEALELVRAASRGYGGD